jgi:hypothetical protein
MRVALTLVVSTIAGVRHELFQTGPISLEETLPEK